jgi:hypothetical protein
VFVSGEPCTNRCYDLGERLGHALYVVGEIDAQFAVRVEGDYVIISASNPTDVRERDYECSFCSKITHEFYAMVLEASATMEGYEVSTRTRTCSISIPGVRQGPLSVLCGYSDCRTTARVKTQFEHVNVVEPCPSGVPCGPICVP